MAHRIISYELKKEVRNWQSLSAVSAAIQKRADANRKHVLNAAQRERSQR